MLSDRDRALLEFEDAHPIPGGAKPDLIKTTFGLSAARYYQRLNRIIDDAAALQDAPLLVRRLQRLRRQRMAARAS
ncbi:hypothetical protein GCM10022239_03220 [Leifsonia bigeumensis]|uniref:DUF3263 domain-containing protein n=1 Tax=Leifsonella bigeumensis TaxID=433643 RepID=A0ABP7F235_9MICO